MEITLDKTFILVMCHKDIVSVVEKYKIVKSKI